jgi:hypothetical protein
MPGSGVTSLTPNVWITSPYAAVMSKPQWFSFEATAATQYIHISTTDALSSVSSIQLFNSANVAVESQEPGPSNSNPTVSFSRTVMPGETYYILCNPGNGSFRIAFSESSDPPPQ